MSGRSLEPLDSIRKPSWFREHLKLVVIGVLVVLAVIGVVVAKMVAERAADRSIAERVERLEVMLEDATPDDFLAFNVGVKRVGSLAQQMRDEPGFVNVKAGAAQATIRIQPSGWWSGFTERCIVIAVMESGPVIDVPKMPCVRVPVDGP